MNKTLCIPGIFLSICVIIIGLLQFLISKEQDLLLYLLIYFKSMIIIILGLSGIVHFKGD